jgi:hypothetical protein
MISLDVLSKFVGGRIKRVNNNILLAQRHKMETFLHETEKSHFIDLKQVVDLLCNEPSLHPRECEACGNPFIPKAKNQKACDDKCRVRLHRERKEQSK